MDQPNKHQHNPTAQAQVAPPPTVPNPAPNAPGDANPGPVPTQNLPQDW